MNYFSSLAKESADEILQEMVGGKSVQEFRNKFGEESFNQFVASLRNDSELVAKNRMKWAVTPKTILGLLGYYLDALGAEYEKAGNGYYVWEEDGYSVYEMLFRVDEKNRQITLTHDLELPVPEGRKRNVSRLLTKIHNMLYNEDFKLEIYNGHVRWETSHTVRNDIPNDSMPGDVMSRFKVPAMIDSIVESFQTVYPALMAVFYEGENADDAVELIDG